MKPILYDRDEMTFTSNGLGRLSDCIDCEVSTELGTGIFECDFTYPITGEKFNEIQLGRIIGATHDDTGDLQPFDIVSYSRPIDGIVSFHAVHVAYRLTRYIATKPSWSVDSALRATIMFENAYPRNIAGHFSYSTFEKSGVMPATTDGIPRSVREYIGMQGGFLDTYGGDVIWDKFRVRFVPERGQRRDFSIRYGVNMVDFNDEADGQETFTQAVPYWSGGEETVVGGLVESGLTPYDRPLCAAMDLTEQFEEAPTPAQLEAKALEIMLSTAPNLPKRTITVEFVRLQDLEPGFQGLLDCELGDRINVIFPGYNMQEEFRIVKTVWNVLLDRYESMTLGSLETTLSQALGIKPPGRELNGGGGGASDLLYGTCDTAAATVAKEATVPGFTTEMLTTGAVVFVKFTYANGASNPTLNINSTGAKAIKRYGTTAVGSSAGTSWNAGAVVCLIYDGTNWIIESWLNTTYSGMTDAEYQAGTSTTNRLITPARLKDAILYHATPANIGALATANKYTRSTTGTLDWTNQTDGDAKVIMKSALAYWNGCYSGTNSNLSRSSAGTIVGRNYICYANSRVDSFSSGKVTIANTSLGVTTGAKPVGILLTPSSSTVSMRYHYDGSDATNSEIRAYNMDGSAFEGNLRYFCVVFQNSWTTT